MKPETSTPLPPYFSIDPDQALMQLGPPATTAGFEEIAKACEAGRHDLSTRGLEENGARSLRMFSTWEITRYLIPVATGHFRRVLKQNPDLPQGRSETTGGAKWFTLDEVLRLRAHFAAEGSKAKNYLPYRPKGQPAKMVAVANFKGGVGKTSTAAHLAMSAALDGYKVLVVDLDSQGSMTSIFGGKVEDEWQTVFPNTWLLSEVDPLSPIAHKHPFVPTDMIGLVRLGSRPTSDDTALALFKAALGVLTEEARLTGTALILRDHAHSHFTHGPGVPDRLTLQEIVQESHEVLGLVSVRHPLDSYLSLQKNKWVHFTPGTLTEYCRRSLIFLDRHQTTPILRYEDFVTQPDDHMAWVCAQLDLPYSPDYARLFATIKLSGSSGRVSHTIGPLRPRRPVNDAVAAELHNSTCYETLCDRLGYDPDPASPALRPEGVRGQG